MENHHKLNKKNNKEKIVALNLNVSSTYDDALEVEWHQPLFSKHKEIRSNRSSHRRCSIKKVLFKILQNSQENTSTRDSFLIKLQAETFNFTKKETLTQRLSYELSEIFKSTFLQNNFMRLLLKQPRRVFRILLNICDGAILGKWFTAFSH